MTLRRVAHSRRELMDLLIRGPLSRMPARKWEPLLINAVAQLAELQDLVERGLVSPAEFRRQRSKIFGS